MYTIRTAGPADWPVIHEMQNVPLREELMTAPLPPRDVFLENARAQAESGEAVYFVLEGQRSPSGFIWLSVCQQSTVVWGQWLETLVFAAAKIAFEHLNLPRVVWTVRNGNRRMLHVCDRFGFRRTGEKSFFHITPGFSFIAAGIAVYFEMTEAEYRRACPGWANRHLPLVFALDAPARLPAQERSMKDCEAHR